MLALLLLAALVAELSTPLHAASQWEFPPLIEVYSDAFIEARSLKEPNGDGLSPPERLFAKMQEAPTTRTLLGLRFAGVLADVEMLPCSIVEQRLADGAREALVQQRRWGAEPLIYTAMTMRPGEGSAELHDYLMMQFLDDEVPGNATATTRLYEAGLQLWPDGLRPHLHRIWDHHYALRATGLEYGQVPELDQRGQYLAMLMLTDVLRLHRIDTQELNAMRGRDAFPDMFFATADDEKRIANLCMRMILTNANQEVIHGIAWHGANWLLMDRLAHHTDQLAVLAKYAPYHGQMPRRVFNALARSGNLHLLIEKDFEPLLIDLVSYWRNSRFTYLVDALNGRWSDSDNEQTFFHYYGYHSVAVMQGMNKAAPFLHQNRDIIHAIIRPLREAGDWSENRSRRSFLLQTGDAASATNIWYAQMAAIAENEYRHGSYRMPGYVLTEGMDAGLIPPRELMEAGLNVAAELRQVWMASTLIDTMTSVIPDWSLMDYPEVVALLIDNLKDDSVCSNGAEAYRHLYAIRTELTDLLTLLHTDEEQDWQVRRAAFRLLNNYSILGEGSPETSPRRSLGPRYWWW